LYYLQQLPSKQWSILKRGRFSQEPTPKYFFFKHIGNQQASIVLDLVSFFPTRLPLLRCKPVEDDYSITEVTR
jgi:hypothetical protein